ncbi:hypothetical protein NC651_037814 [Populus alba x Populus x berolinensis]|nr:hypothetical protein NC651_037814 [Populus alba x Populus x berolinensis]
MRIPTTPPPVNGSKRCRRRTTSCRIRPSARSTTKPAGSSPVVALAAGGSTPAASVVSTWAATAPSSISTICSTPRAAAVAPTSATSSAACSDAARAVVPAGPGVATIWKPRLSWISSRPPMASRCRCG